MWGTDGQEDTAINQYNNDFLVNRKGKQYVSYKRTISEILLEHEKIAESAIQKTVQKGILEMEDQVNEDEEEHNTEVQCQKQMKGKAIYSLCDLERLLIL